MRRSARGFTLVEVAVVLAVVGILVLVSAPNMSRWQRDQRLSGAARSVAGILSTARSQAVHSGSFHLVFLQTDAEGNALVDTFGNAVPMAILNDGPPGGANQNCKIDAGEPLETYPAVRDVAWGVTNASGATGSDLGAGDHATGQSFTEPDGVTQARWVLFRPDGFPVTFDKDCNFGATGSGAGAVYVTNGFREYAIVLSPLGAVNVETWDRIAAEWSGS